MARKAVLVACHLLEDDWTTISLSTGEFQYCKERAYLLEVPWNTFLRSDILTMFWRVLLLYGASHLLVNLETMFPRGNALPTYYNAFRTISSLYSVGRYSKFIPQERYRHLLETFSTVMSVPSGGILLDFVPNE
jgi:hypothetical protein